MAKKEFTMNDVPEVMGEILNKVEKLEKAQTQPQQESEEYLTRKEVMDVLKISSYTTVIRLEREGILKPIKMRRKYLYKKSEVSKIEDFL